MCGGDDDVVVPPPPPPPPPPPAPPPPPEFEMPEFEWPEFPSFEEDPEEIAFRKKLREDYLARIEGTLEVPEALETSIAESEAQLRETLLRSLGPGYETASPGIEALSKFQKRSEELRDQARHGQPYETTSLLSGYMGLGGQQQQLDLARLQSMMGLGELQARMAAQYGLAGYEAQLQNQRLQYDYLNNLASLDAYRNMYGQAGNDRMWNSLIGAAGMWAGGGFKMPNWSWSLTPGGSSWNYGSFALPEWSPEDYLPAVPM